MLVGVYRLSIVVFGYIVCYIVSVVVIKEGCVLMMREVKRFCWGMWYLLVGRVEKNEFLEEVVVREVLEEIGFVF